MVSNCGVEGLSSKYEVTLEQVDKDSQDFRKEDFAPMQEEDEDIH